MGVRGAITSFYFIIIIFFLFTYQQISVVVACEMINLIVKDQRNVLKCKTNHNEMFLTQFTGWHHRSPGSCSERWREPHWANTMAARNNPWNWPRKQCEPSLTANGNIAVAGTASSLGLKKGCLLCTLRSCMRNTKVHVIAHRFLCFPLDLNTWSLCSQSVHHYIVVKFK